MASKIVDHDPELGPLTCDLLTRDVRLFQRAKGHRFSSDDVATAYVAFAARPDASCVLDLGCGIGSVLLLLAWKLPTAQFSGIEAQAMSFELLRRNVERSGFAARVRVAQGDLRDGEALARLGGPYDLITGTPPYFPPEAALDAEDEQRAFARIEYRGGVEAYIGAAAPLLAPSGAFVLCGDARVGERTDAAARLARLNVRGRCDVFARAGRPPLFSIWTLCREDGTLSVSSLVLRGPSGESAEGATRLREFSGFSSASS